MTLENNNKLINLYVIWFSSNMLDYFLKSSLLLARNLPYLLFNSTVHLNVHYRQIFLSWHLGAERQTCHVTLIVAYVMN